MASRGNPCYCKSKSGCVEAVHLIYDLSCWFKVLFNGIQNKIKEDKAGYAFEHYTTDMHYDFTLICSV